MRATSVDDVTGRQQQQQQQQAAAPVMKTIAARRHWAALRTVNIVNTDSRRDDTEHYLQLTDWWRRDAIGNESVSIQLTQCWFPGLAISNAKI